MDKKFTDKKKPFGRKPFDGKKSEGKPFEKKSFEKKPFDKKDGEGRKTFEKKSFEKKTFQKKDGEKKSFEKKPFEKKVFEKKAFDKKEFEKKPFERKPFDKKGERAAKPAFKGPDARRVALSALQDVNRFDAYAALALDKRLRESRLSPDDRRLATSIFYQAVENRLNIEYVLNSFVSVKPDAVIEDILHIACAQILFMDKIPPHAAVDEAVKQARALGKDEATGFVNGVLRNLLRAIEGEGIKYPDENEDKVKYLSVRYSVNEVILNRLISAYGIETAEKIVAFRPAERVETIRPHLMKRDCAQFEEYLTKRGWAWKKGVVEGAYLISHAGNLAGDPDFFDGEFSIQGESSMLSAIAVNAKPGMTVIDVCAAPGGKSALMCEMMKGTGRVHAWDVHPHRVDLLKAMGKRLKLDNLRAAVRDASVTKEEFHLSADAVLIDAPCSGVGVMTDKPDLKYRVTDESIDSLIETQKKILKASSQYVKRGGVLVYSTCSILPEENEKQVEAFLFDHPEFKLDTDAGWVPEALKDRFTGGMLSLLPDRDGVEGFFIARMRRVNV